MLKHIQTSLAIILSASLILWGVATGIAGSGTITVKDSTGATQTYAVVTDGSGHYIAVQVLCDYSAGANCATVNASHQLGIAGPVTAISGGFVDGSIATIGALADAAWTSGSGSVIAILKYIGNEAAAVVSALSTSNGY